MLFILFHFHPQFINNNILRHTNIGYYMGEGYTKNNDNGTKPLKLRLLNYHMHLCISRGNVRL